MARTTVRTAFSLFGINRKRVVFYFLHPCEIIVYELEA
jgi:transposase